MGPAKFKMDPNPAGGHKNSGPQNREIYEGIYYKTAAKGGSTNLKLRRSSSRLFSSVYAFLAHPRGIYFYGKKDPVKKYFFILENHFPKVFVGGFFL